MRAAGRSVVASAPALGAGDREFESPRPDRPRRSVPSPCAASPVVRRRPIEEPADREERPRDPEPHPGPVDRRGPVRGAQAEPGHGVQEDRRPGQHPRLPQGQGATAGHRPALRPRRWCSRRRSTRRCPSSTARPSRRTTSRCSGRPEVDVTKFEDGEQLTFTAEVDVRPDFELPDYRGLDVTVDDAETSDDDLDEQIAVAARALRDAEGRRPAAADGDFVSIDLSADHRRREPSRTSAPRACPTRSARARCSTASTSAITGLSAGESAVVLDRPRRWRPRRRGRRGDRHRQLRQGA